MRLDAAIDAYLSHLRVERALSPHSVAAYGRDLGKLAAFAESRGVSNPKAIDRGTFSSWLGSLAKSGLGPRSAARHLSAARGLMRFLVREGVIASDPTELAVRPKVGRKLPHPLGELDVVRMIETPSVESERGLRDRAMLSVAYAAGLRVSELVGLRLGDVDLERGILAALGKGGKRRLVPLGEVAIAHVEEYLAVRKIRSAAAVAAARPVSIARASFSPDRVGGR